MPRNYTGEYKNYQGTPAQRKRNDARKAARRKMVASGACLLYTSPSPRD